MPAAIRIVTRIQDQDDFSGTPNNGETMFWNAAGGYFEPVSAATARTNLGLVAGGAGDIWLEKAGDTMTGALLVADGSAANPSLARSSASTTGLFFSFGTPAISISGTERYSFTAEDFYIQNNLIKIRLGASADLTLGREAAATLVLGWVAASPTTQTLKAHNGSGTNIAGANLTVAGGKGTGTGAGGSLLLATSPVGASGSSQNALVTAAEIDDQATGGEETRLLLLDLSDGTLKRVVFGADGSGGTGLKLLAVAN